MTEHVILVDDRNQEIGTAEKMEAHEKGWLHRAISVLLFNSKGEVLLQQRNPAKYHSGGLWSNTCCSHPRPGELPVEAAVRRLQEEMGIWCDLEWAFDLQYRTRFAGGLIENEYDHVFTGLFDGAPVPNVEEVSAWRWMDRETLLDEIRARPGAYTYWFHLI